MTSCPPEVQTSLKRDATVEEAIRQRVRGLLAGLHSRDYALDRREDRRYPYPYLVRLTPVAADGVTPLGRSVVVVGKRLSERGLTIYHPEPLAHRRMIAALDTAHGGHLSLLIDLTWCRFTGHGWYESGGRFLRCADA